MNIPKNKNKNKIRVDTKFGKKNKDFQQIKKKCECDTVEKSFFPPPPIKKKKKLQLKDIFNVGKNKDKK